MAVILRATREDFEEFMRELREEYEHTSIPEQTRLSGSGEKLVIPALIGLWHASHKYTDDNGEPRTLPVKGEGASLDALLKEAISIEGIEYN
jgi:hypothetical protein